MLDHKYVIHMHVPGFTDPQVKVLSRLTVDFFFHLNFLFCIGVQLIEEGMVTHSIILAWRIPWTEEPGGLQSIESHRVGHN